MTSLRPHLVRALIDWIVENDQTPHVIIDCTVDNVDAPMDQAQDGKLVLNVSARATRNLLIDAQWLHVDCRFSGRSMRIQAPIGAIVGVYSKEGGAGMVFEPEPADQADSEAENADASPEAAPKQPRQGGPKLTLVK